MRSQNADTALHVAALKGHAAAVSVLIAAGVAVSAANKAGYRAVHYAADSGSLATLTALLDAAPGERCASGERSGETPLHRAALSGRQAAVAELLARGAAVDAPDTARRPHPRLDARASTTRAHSDSERRRRRRQAGATPLLRACERGEMAVAEQLLAAGAAPSARDKVRAIAAPLGALLPRPRAPPSPLSSALPWSQAGRSPLLAAIATAAHTDLAWALLVRGADALAADGQGVTPLHAAATRGLAPLAEELLRRGARQTEAADGRTPRECAAIGSAVRALLQAG